MKTGLPVVASFLLATAACAEEPLRTVIDREIAAGWKAKKITPAEPASDAEFLRRISLDLHGQIPTYKQAVSFLESKDPRKREKLIDTLLADRRYAVHQTDLWDLFYFTRNPPGFGTRDRQGFQDWLRKQFENNTPYDQWVRTLLKADGNTVDHGVPMFFVQYKGRPEDATEAVTQKFLGVQLQCARCHDHPFEDVSQTDFYGMAAFLARLQVVTVGKKGRISKFAIGEKNNGDVLFTGPVQEQRPGQKGKPVAPKFLHGKPLAEPKTNAKDPRRFPNNKMPPKPKFSRKDALAEWITDAKNPYFAKAAVNRIWSQFMGRGIVHPVDNLSPSNPATHPKLLDEMTRQFIAHKFDLKWLIREIVNSKAYQLSSAGTATDEKPIAYQRARFRPLSAEELFESWKIATGYDAARKSDREKRKSAGRFAAAGFTWDYMLRYFGKPADGVGNFQGGIHEHLYLNNGQIHTLITKSKGGLYETIAKSSEPWENRVERLFVQILSRRPSAAEKKKFVAYLTEKDDGANRLHEAIWTLMSCSEFRFNH